MGEKWYELYDRENGQPVCYLKNKNSLLELKKNYLRFSKIRELDHRPAQLEFMVKLDGDLMGSFEFENHAMRYNLEQLGWRGEIHPNTQEDQLKLYL